MKYRIKTGQDYVSNKRGFVLEYMLTNKWIEVLDYNRRGMLSDEPARSIIFKTEQAARKYAEKMMPSFNNEEAVISEFEL